MSAGNTWTMSVGDQVLQAATDTGFGHLDLAALSGGGAVLSWTNVANSYYTTDAAVLNNDGSQAVAPFEASPAIGFGNGLDAVSSLANGNFVLTFDIKDPSYWGVATRVLDADGAEVGATRRVNVFTEDNQEDGRSVQINNGNIISIWSSAGQDEGLSGIYGRLSDASGAAASGEFQINTSPLRIGGNPEVTALSDGGFLVVWTFYIDGAARIASQRFDAGGSALGDEVLLDVVAYPYGGAAPLLATLANGNVAIVWASNEDDRHDSGEGVFVQVINPDGVTVTPATHVDSGFRGNQANPDITALADGGFMISWEDDRVDDVVGNYGIMGRRYDAAGDPIGEEFVVNLGGKASLGFNGYPGAPLAQLSDGSVMFSWLEDPADVARTVHTRSFDLASYIVGDDDDNWMDTGTEGADTMRGLDGHDWLFGNGGDDYLDAGDGDDEVSGGAGNDTLVGGEGSDTVFIDVNVDAFTTQYLTDGLQVTSAEGTDQIADDIEEFFFLDGALSYADVEALASGADTDGTPEADTLIGTPGDDTLSGLGGDDVIEGRDGADILQGLSGADTLNGQAGDDTLVGGEGDDDLTGGPGDDRIDGGPGTDFARIGADSADIAVARSGTGLVVTSSDGTDRLAYGIETLIFSDRSMSWSEVDALAPGGTDQFGSVFDVDMEGWTASNGTQTYLATGGNPGGAVRATEGGGGVWTFEAPQAFLGDQSRFYGGTLHFDLRQDGTESQFSDVDVTLVGGGLTLAIDSGDNPGTDWTSYDVKLDLGASWKVGGLSGRIASAEEVEAALANVEQLAIRGEFVEGTTGDASEIDNVYLSEGTPLQPDAGAPSVSSTFDTGTDGWSFVNDVREFRQVGEQGNPGGYLEAVDYTTGETWYFVAPQAFLGNKAAFYGGQLSFDLKQSSTSSQFDNDDVKLFGAGLTLVHDLTHPGTDWSPYALNLDAGADWRVGSESGDVATEAQIRDVLADLVSLHIRGEYVSGSDTGGLDNVVLRTGGVVRRLSAPDGDELGTYASLQAAVDAAQPGETITIESTAAPAVAIVETSNLRFAADAPFTAELTLGPDIDAVSLAGSAAIDVIGDVGAQRISGNLGNNRLVGGDDADTLLGDDGADTLLGGDGNDSLEGGNGDDSLEGGDADDTLDGGLGEDVMRGGLGADVMRGGQNGDFYIVDDVADVVVELAGDVGIDRVASSVDLDMTGIDVETLILGGSANTDATGNDKNNYILGSLGNNEIDGGGGNDRIEAAGGDDTLRGGAGDDTLNGGPGSDVFYIDDAGDRVAESRRWEGEDHVIASVDFRMGSAHIETLELVGTARLGAGNGLRNTITGNDGDNLLDGGKNVDTLIGGAGDDIYLLRAPGDNAVELAGGGIDTVRAFRTIELDANVENLHIQTLRNAAGEGVPGVNGFGNDLDNTIVGNPFANFIAGRGGNDTLRGQGGADTFVFDTALGAENADTILDFNVGTGNNGDRLYMEQSVFTGVVKGELAAGLFSDGTVAADANDRFVYDGMTGRLYFDADGAGGAAQQLIATFANGATVEASDIFLV